MGPSVVVLDYGCGNVHSAVRMLERVGATVKLTADPASVSAADGLFVPGVGNFHACMRGLTAVRGPRLVDQRLAGGRAVLGICVGMQVMFEGSTEPSADGGVAGLAQWPGMVERLDATVVPHMGWSPVEVPADSVMFRGVECERFYFVHSYAAPGWTLESHGSIAAAAPKVTWSRHGSRFVAAVENSPLWAAQFHPEKSGEAGARVLGNWVATL